MEYIPILKDIDFNALYMRMNEMVYLNLFQDFQGQQLAIKTYRIILTSFLIIAMIVSFVTQKLSNGIFTMCAGIVISMLVNITLI
jgi:hypothetical protein